MSLVESLEDIFTCMGRETGPVVADYCRGRARLRWRELEPRWLSTLRIEAAEKRLSKRLVFKNTEPFCRPFFTSDCTNVPIKRLSENKTFKKVHRLSPLAVPPSEIAGLSQPKPLACGVNPFVPHPKFVTTLSAVTGLWTVSGSSIGSCCAHGSMHHFPLLPRGKCRHLLGLS